MKRAKLIFIKLTAFTLIFAAFVVMVFALRINSASAPVNKDTDTIDKTTSYIFTAEKDNQNALRLINKHVKLGTKKYSFGIMIESVNGIKADKDSFWAFYINNKFAQKGVSDTFLSKGDKIELRLEKIKK